MKLKIVLFITLAIIVYIAVMFLSEIFAFSDFFTNSVSTPVLFVLYGFLSLLTTAIVVITFCLSRPKKG